MWFINLLWTEKVLGRSLVPRHAARGPRALRAHALTLENQTHVNYCEVQEVEIGYAVVSHCSVQPGCRHENQSHEAVETTDEVSEWAGSTEGDPTTPSPAVSAERDCLCSSRGRPRRAAGKTCCFFLRVSTSPACDVKRPRSSQW